MKDTGEVPPKYLQGDVGLHIVGDPLNFKLLDYWRWAHSDLLSNTERGVLAEYIVATAIGSVSNARKEWEPFDLQTRDGTKVEVKSAAYLQSWHQRNDTKIKFRIAPTKYWDSNEGVYMGPIRRQSDVYVFAVLANKNPKTIDPLDLSQWEFYVMATGKIDKTKSSQRTISMGVLEKMGARRSDYRGIERSIAQEMEVYRLGT